MVHEIENFYGVYLLYCLNPKYKGRTYIGFTVNPNRRIKQHNKGTQFGGARRTNGKGPWEMVLIIHGFPNMISALRFEWAWTKPDQSRRLREITPKKKNEAKYDHCIRILCCMLSTGPWNRLPLTIRWLNQEYQRNLGMIHDPPYHMSIQYGPVKSIRPKNLENKETTENTDQLFCSLCSLSIQNCSEEQITCFNCKTPFHIICLAKEFLKSPKGEMQLIPIEGACPKCSLSILWGDLIRYKRGCYQGDLSQTQDTSEDAFTEWRDKMTK